MPNIYADMLTRMGGELYFGLVGPVRTGKSTLIGELARHLILPYITDTYEKQRLIDELPQSAEGKTVMTTEPKFIPRTQIEVDLNLDQTLKAKVRFIDCVGFMSAAALGGMEDGKERMVNTPWMEEPIAFSQAADIGTTKVIEQSGIVLLVTTDGSITDLKREDYLEAEMRAVKECKEAGKPFLILLNSSAPESKEAKEASEQIKSQYGMEPVIIDAKHLSQIDIEMIMKRALATFPVMQVEIAVPDWVCMLPKEHVLRQEIITYLLEIKDQIGCIQDLMDMQFQPDKECGIRSCAVVSVNSCTGCATIKLQLDDQIYYKYLTELTGEQIDSKECFALYLNKVIAERAGVRSVVSSLSEAGESGYSIMLPIKDDIVLEEPTLISSGGKYGVRIQAMAPSMHLIKVPVTTEIAPIVGTKEQAQDLIDYIKGSDQESIWDTNIFGKTVGELVSDGIKTKVSMIGEDGKEKLCESMEKIVNDTTNGLVCILI